MYQPINWIVVDFAIIIQMKYFIIINRKINFSFNIKFYYKQYVWVEKNHITDVGVKYDGLSRKVDHKPSHWRCEDEIERGKYINYKN